ncbi:protein LURP-one-related 8 [Amborella trichopoda]|nr:protein LURP-one-related 8 [Amborella trichopoda]|eukprot:XP_020521824.1 protein LURP-one-related 8 [Amborella trichopoda]
MSRIHPGKDKYSTEEQRATGPPTVSTVWKKSSMGFQGTDGFTVFDSNGNIAFRVDNYTRNSRCLTNGPVHKDGTGAALFTLCPKIFSIHEQWEGFRGEACRKRRQRRPFFSIRRCSVFQREDKRMFAWVLQR